VGGKGFIESLGATELDQVRNMVSSRLNK